MALHKVILRPDPPTCLCASAASLSDRRHTCRLPPETRWQRSRPAGSVVALPGGRAGEDLVGGLVPDVGLGVVVQPVGRPGRGGAARRDTASAIGSAANRRTPQTERERFFRYTRIVEADLTWTADKEVGNRRVRRSLRSTVVRSTTAVSKAEPPTERRAAPASRLCGRRTRGLIGRRLCSWRCPECGA
jgi:hypothetical protein